MVAKNVERFVSSTDKTMEPVRRSFFMRFPTLALLLVTFGVAATIFGIEQFIMEVEWLSDRPLFIFALGIGILVLTGRLSKKLG